MKPYWVVYKYDGNLFYDIYIIVIFIYIYLKLIKNTHTLLVCVFFCFYGASYSRRDPYL